MTDKLRSIYANLNPLDHRYARDEKVFSKLSPYFSEESRLKMEARVEVALVAALHQEGLAPAAAVKETQSAVEKITAAAVYREEEKTRHNTRALVNCLRQNVSPENRQYIHLGATSFDIIDNGAVLRYRSFTREVLLPELIELTDKLLEIAQREKETPQVGRTHGQQAVPLTFGYYLAGFVSRLGQRIEEIVFRTNSLRGKFSGAVGAYNALDLLVDDPLAFEKNLLASLDLKPAEHSSQILPPEPLTDYFHSLVSTLGVLADLSDDMRHLQRSEISEVGEAFEENQVGSSTMPQKRNPINFENVKGSWKTFLPRMFTIYQDQLSEHQRDLTNSTTARYYPEIPIGLFLAAHRLNKVFKRFVVDNRQMNSNLAAGSSLLAAEPLYILLAREGHPDAHEAVRQLTLKVENHLEANSTKNNSKVSKINRYDSLDSINTKENKANKDINNNTTKLLWEFACQDTDLQPYLSAFSDREKNLLQNSARYLGRSAEKTEIITERWRQKLNDIKRKLKD